MSDDDHVAACTSLPPTYISVCSGGAGLDAGVRLAWPRARAVCYVERELTEAAVLAKGIEVGFVPDAPIWSDYLTFGGREWRGRVGGIVGGIPCQPHSFAGKRLGADDVRDLWPLTARLVWDVAPAWVFLENVPGIAFYYWTRIRPDLQALGYEVTEGIFSAEAVGASHLRERLFILAYLKGARSRRLPVRPGEPRLAERDAGWRGEAVADTIHGRRSGRASEPGPRQSGRVAAGRASEELAHALDGTRGTEHEQQHGQRADVAGRGGAALEHTTHVGHEWGWQTRNRRSRSESSDRDLGNPTGTRLQGPRLEACAESRPELGRANLSAFPPGPADRDGWERWLRERPGTEPAVRRGSDGLAFRADRLRVLGNGVVPVEAADAFRTLAARLGMLR